MNALLLHPPDGYPRMVPRANGGFKRGAPEAAADAAAFLVGGKARLSLRGLKCGACSRRFLAGRVRLATDQEECSEGGGGGGCGCTHERESSIGALGADSGSQAETRNEARSRVRCG